MRGLVGAGLLFLATLAALWALPPIVLVPYFLLGPAIVAAITTRPAPSRERYQWHGIGFAITLAIASDAWVAARWDASPFALLASLPLTFLVVSLTTTVPVVLWSNRYPKEGAASSARDAYTPGGEFENVLTPRRAPSQDSRKGREDGKPRTPPRT